MGFRLSGSPPCVSILVFHCYVDYGKIASSGMQCHDSSLGQAFIFGAYQRSLDCLVHKYVDD